MQVTFFLVVLNRLCVVRVIEGVKVKGTSNWGVGEGGGPGPSAL